MVSAPIRPRRSDAHVEPALLLVLDGVTDPHNLGACLRVADAAGAHAVFAPKDRAAGIGAAVSKVASGICLFESRRRRLQAGG